MTLKVDKRYLVLPVSEHAQVKKLYFRGVNGELLYDLDVRLDPVGAQHTYYADLGRYLGQAIQFDIQPAVDYLPVLTDHVSAENGRFRPQAHFTPERGWINDPNGLVFYQGTYHLFYQHNPVGMHWGNMHWGHAVSSDLVHWEEKEIALFPDELGTMYSGSAVIDERNVSGLQNGEDAPVLLFYTAAGDRSALSAGKEHVQCLAYSTDGGKTFKKYGNKPIIDHIIGGNRDPKVVFCPEIGKYVLALYLDGAEYALFVSENLIDWEMIQKIDLPGDSECPDFFPLWLDGEKYWILSGASDFYYVGRMESGKFVPVQEVLRLETAGSTGYAAQTYFGLPDNRRVRFYWNRYNLPGMAFNCSMSTPVDLFLLRREGKIMLGCRPVPEFDALHGKTATGNGKVLLPGKANDIRAEIPADSGIREISLFGLSMVVDTDNGVVRVGKDEMQTYSSDGKFILRIIQDVHSTEVFTQDGAGYCCAGHLADLSLNYVCAPDDVFIDAKELIS